MSVLRTYAAFLVGSSKMCWRKFLPANASGGIIWVGAYTLASYLADNALRRSRAPSTGCWPTRQWWPSSPYWS